MRHALCDLFIPILAQLNANIFGQRLEEVDVFIGPSGHGWKAIILIHSDPTPFEKIIKPFGISSHDYTHAGALVRF